MIGLAALGLILVKGEFVYEKIKILYCEFNIVGVFALMILVVWFLVGCIDYFYYFRLLIRCCKAKLRD